MIFEQKDLDKTQRLKNSVAESKLKLSEEAMQVLTTDFSTDPKSYFVTKSSPAVQQVKG